MEDAGSTGATVVSIFATKDTGLDLELVASRLPANAVQAIGFQAGAGRTVEEDFQSFFVDPRRKL